MSCSKRLRYSECANRAGSSASKCCGDVLNDAVYDRSRTIEEGFNARLEYIADDYNQTSADVLNPVTSVDDDF